MLPRSRGRVLEGDEKDTKRGNGRKEKKKERTASKDKKRGT